MHMLVAVGRISPPLSPRPGPSISSNTGPAYSPSLTDKNNLVYGFKDHLIITRLAGTDRPNRYIITDFCIS